MTRINLLPAEERAKAAREQGLALVGLGLLVLVIALGAVYLVESRRVSSKQDEVTQVKAQIDQANRQVAELKPYETLAQQTATMKGTAVAIYDSRVGWSNILEEVSLVIPDNVSLFKMVGTVPPTMQAGVGGSAEGSASTTPGLQFQGNAWNYQDIAEFMTRLGLLPQLKDIRLEFATKVSSGEGAPETIEFTIDANLRPFQTPVPLAGATGGGG
jgi:type IV pilus assembly protein PilN